MTSCIMWSIPDEVLENAVQMALKLETTPSVLAAGYDEIGQCINVLIEVDPKELDALGIISEDAVCAAVEGGQLVN